jgi:multisubunit Na+/H+ antiporter MnhE subunit
MHYLLIIVPLLFIYLELSSNFELSNIVVGLIIVTGIAKFVRPQHLPSDWSRLPSSVFALVRYLVILVYDVIASGIQVARVVLDPALPIKPGIVSIPSQCDSEMGTALSAHAITLAPGEMVVEIDEKGVMYTSCLDTTNSEKYVEDAQKMRKDLLQKIFT